MLVLTRKLDEEIIIKIGSTEVSVSVVGFKGNRFQLGFDAPDKVTILRSETVIAKDSTFWSWQSLKQKVKRFIGDKNG